MFEELGLNVARQPDNAREPAPGQPRGWMDGETPDVIEALAGRRAAEPGRAGDQALGSLDAASLQGQAQSTPRPDGHPKGGTSGGSIRHGAGGLVAMSEIAERLASGAPRSLAAPADDLRPAGADVLLDGRPCCCCARTTTSGWPTTRACVRRPRTRRALGRRRRCLAARVGLDDDPQAAGGTPRRVRGHPVLPAVRLRVPREPGRDRRARRGRGRDLLRRAQPRIDRRRLPPVARRGRRLPPPRRGAPRLVPAPPRRAPRRARDRDRLGVLDGRRHRAARAHRRARPDLRRAARGRRGARDRQRRARRPRRGRRGGAGGRGRRRDRDARQGARLLRRVRVREPRDRRVPGQHGAVADLLDRPGAAAGRGRVGRAGPAARAPAPGRPAPFQRRTLRGALAGRGSPSPRARCTSCR